jgi:AraC-like DNA-binding protein
VSAGREERPDLSALQMLRQARDRIDRDYAEPVGIAALAAAAGYSHTHFIRAVRAAYGETPGAYRTRRRVERACELLRSVNLSVTEICHAVGFTSLGSFSARFSGLMGQSPSAYRAEAARRGGPAPIPGCFALMWWTGLPAAPGPAPGPVPAARSPVDGPETAAAGPVSAAPGPVPAPSPPQERRPAAPRSAISEKRPAPGQP